MRFCKGKNIAIVAGLSLSMTLGGLPVTAIAETLNSNEGTVSAAAETEKATVYLGVIDGGATLYDSGKMTVDAGSAVAVPEAAFSATPAGCVIAGWQDSSNGVVYKSDLSDFTPVAGATYALTAVIEAVELPDAGEATVTIGVLDPETGSVLFDFTRTLTAGSHFVVPEKAREVVPEAYEIAGWYDASTGKTYGTTLSDLSLEKGDSVTLTAVLQTKAKVYFGVVLDGTTYFDSSQFVSSGSGVTVPMEAFKSVPSGYLLNGWVDNMGNEYDPMLTGFTASAGENITLMAKLEPIPELPDSGQAQVYFAVVDVDGSVLYTASKTYEAGSHVVAPKAAFEAVPEGYELVGWIDNMGNEYDSELSGLTLEKGDNIALTAQLQALPDLDTTQITSFVANGGKFADGSEFQQVAKQSDGTIVLPLQPVREGYVFTGWTYGKDSGDFYQPGDKAEGKNTTLFAQWDKVELPETGETTVVFGVIDPETGSVLFDFTRTFTNGSHIVAPKDAFEAVPEGYELVGWIDNNGVAHDRALTGVVAGKDGVTALQAVLQKEDVETATAVYHDADGSVLAEVLYADGESFGAFDRDRVVEEKLVVPEGKTFLGWAFEADATEALDRNATPLTGSVDLYPVFEDVAPEPVVKHTVTFTSCGDSWTVEVEDGQVVAKPADPTADGYSFYGWSTDANEYSAYDFSQPVTGDVSLYAFFVKDEVPGEDVKPEEPGKGEDAGKDESKQDAAKDDKELPKTGDASAIAVAATSMVGLATAAAGVFVSKRRK